jgi:hypothetical protein
VGVPEIDVDLDAPAEERWASLHAWRSSARALLRFYVTDLGGLQDFRPIIMSYCEESRPGGSLSRSTRCSVMIVQS